ncbi:MAG: Fic family protein [Candidatus Nitronauta litoralis]|uniref:Fic family protein n=1 Tax=Candidatus Nitronauta litoralis TaxID=2705533 RepID=A0A7T0FZZ8_9BACT|nr:MAG: Fic family protein [Candidatus Nitronauta litoralis]
MEPMVLPQDSSHRSGLMDIALDLAAKSSGFRRSLAPGIYQALAPLVRTMNCYYSNLIEDHNTHPVDIERSMKNDFSEEPKKRNLQMEARAHVLCQEWVDEGGLQDRFYTVEGLREIHRLFCENLPDDLLWVEDNESEQKVRVVPGALRTRDVRVGNHLAVSPGALPRFLKRFETVYGSLGKSEMILATAAAHHRLLWIHPFIDGNGRVARIMSHAILLDTLDTGGVWSVARGLARSVDQYKNLLQQSDLPRRNDLDGRGSLSEEGLAEFTRYFLEVCRDQVVFMESLVQPERLRTRILIWAEEEIRMKALPEKAGKILEAVLFRGELPRGDIPQIVGAVDRHARRITSALIKAGVLTSDNQRAPLRLAFPAKLADRWLPNLFPEKPD